MARAALLVVDVQEAFLNQHTAGLPERIARHLARRRYDAVAFTVFRKPGMPPSSLRLAPALQGRGPVFRKDEFSAFRAPGLRAFLRKQRIGRLLVCGLDTEACVYASAMDAVAEGFAADILLGLCASRRGPAVHRHAAALVRELWPACSRGGTKERKKKQTP